MSASPEEIVRRTEALAERLAQEQGLEVVAVEWKGGVLRVFVDGEGGVSVAECARLSRKLSAALDQEDFVPGPYTLEVSSPGLTRILRSPREFRWAKGKNVKVFMKDGEVVRGVLKGLSEDSVLVGPWELPLSEVAKVQLDEV